MGSRLERDGFARHHRPKLAKEGLETPARDMIEDGIALRSQLGDDARRLVPMEHNPPQVRRPWLIVPLLEPFAAVEKTKATFSRAEFTPVDPVPILSPVHKMNEIADAIVRAPPHLMLLAACFANPNHMVECLYGHLTGITVVFQIGLQGFLLHVAVPGKIN